MTPLQEATLAFLDALETYGPQTPESKAAALRIRDITLSHAPQKTETKESVSV